MFNITMALTEVFNSVLFTDYGFLCSSLCSGCKARKQFALDDEGAP